MTAEGTWVDPPEYFEKVVYPEYLKNNKLVLLDQDRGDVCVIDSDVETPLAEILHQVTGVLETQLLAFIKSKSLKSIP